MRINIIYIVLISIGGILFSCTQNPSKQEMAPITQNVTPPEFVQGELLFQNNCSICHGVRGSGTDKGPSFLSPIYEPNHHGDESFVLAARNGVRSHHWPFGDMPPLPHVKEDEVRQIVAYVRWLQKEARVY